MLDIHCLYDENGFPHAVVAPPYEAVGWFLEQDIQGSPNSCEEILDLCKGVGDGSEPQWSGTGNAHTLTIGRERVLIENEFTETEVSCSLNDFSAALLAWKNFLARRDP